MKTSLKLIAATVMLGMAAPVIAGNYHYQNGYYAEKKHDEKRKNAPKKLFTFSHLATYTETCPDEACAEISAYDPKTKRVFVTNAEENQLRILEIVDDQFVEIGAIDLSTYGGGPNSVAVRHGLVVVAIEANNKQDNGTVEMFDTDGNHIYTLTVGALPDMLTFTPNGKYLLVANEGEPNDDYDVDPEGSISIINMRNGDISTAGFTKFNHRKLKNVRIYGPNASVAQDLEPEYIAVSPDSKTAWVSLQENNAFAIIDIESAKVKKVVGLGLKKHEKPANALDASNEDEGINIQSWPVYGMYQPDAIATFNKGKETFILSANEGDARDYDGFSEEARVKDLQLDMADYPNAGELQADEKLGRLKTTTATGDDDNDGYVDRIHAYGARSFSIWNEQGKLVWDSGAEFEKRLALLAANGLDTWVESRSDDKGPEPESITTGQLGKDTYAFIGLERTSGIFVYNLTAEDTPRYAGYINVAHYGDVSPEGLVFIPVDKKNGKLLVTNEVSNTTSLYAVSVD